MESLQRQRTPPVDKGAMAALMKGMKEKNMDAQGLKNEQGLGSKWPK